VFPGSSDPLPISSGIASVSDQSIDNYGQVMVDAVTNLGLAYEYHEGSGWTYLASGVKSAKAGQGVSYVLFNNGDLKEYKDSSSTWALIDSNAASLDAGTDKIGVSMVDVVLTSGQAWEYSDSSGWHLLGLGVKSISAGQQGISGFVTTAGDAYTYNEASSVSGLVASNVASLTIGTDQSGNYMMDLLTNAGTLLEYRVASGWTFLNSGIKAVAKGRAGWVVMVSTSGSALGHDSAGWRFLTGNAVMAS
jgi:hypothetical protein